MNQPENRSTMRTVLPIAVVIAAGVLAFLLGVLFTSSKNGVPKGESMASLTAPGASATPGASSAVASPSTSSTSTSAPGPQTTNSSATTSAPNQASTPEATAAFPADGTGLCSPNGKEDNIVALNMPEVRNVKTATSCDFDRALKDKVYEKLNTNPKASNFTVTAYSANKKSDRRYSCSREDHLSTCTHLDTNADAVIYIKDNIS